jgi:hypothetical protein
MTQLVADAADEDQLFLDGKELGVKTISLVDDRREHSVEFKVWRAVSAPKNRGILVPA